MARFDGGLISSDAGMLLFHTLDKQEGFSAEVASCLRDQRDQSYVAHDLTTMVRQRALQIVAGYEDCNDADTLRSDPVFKTVCCRLPESDPDLASQPTLSRLENAVGRSDVMRLGKWLVDRYVRRLKKRRPEKIVLDLDATDDPTHGQQEFSFYHGYFREHVYHPLLVFDAETGELVCALLRAGNRGAAFRAIAVLKRLLRRIRKALGEQVEIEIEVRGDCGFGGPDLYDFCEREKIRYVVGLSRNPRLERITESELEKARQAFEETGEDQRRFVEFDYQAGSWEHPRRVVAKVEVNSMGTNRRFVVTDRRDLPPQQLYEHYTERGQTENFIKAFKNDLAMDRLSCHRFLANQFRLLLHAVAYLMVLRFRDYLYGTPWKKLSIETLRRRCFKIGARVRQTTRRIWVHLSSSFPEQRLFFLVWNRLQPT